VTPEPTVPCSPDGWRQDELVEELAQLIRLDEVADAVFGALAEDLFVDAGPVCSVFQVVGDRPAASANVERKLDVSARLGQERVVEVLGNRYRSCCGAEPPCAGVLHRWDQCTVAVGLRSSDSSLPEYQQMTRLAWCQCSGESQERVVAFVVATTASLSRPSKPARGARSA